MKARYISLVAAISMLFLIGGCSKTSSQTSDDLSKESSGTIQTEYANAVELVSDIATTQYFTDEKVSDDAINTILMAGINAPSAMNGQPWHFSVITDKAVLQQISEDMRSGMSFGWGTPPNGADMPDGKLPDDTELPEGFNPGEGNNFPKPPEGFAGGDSTFTGSVSKAGIADAPLVIVISCTDGSELDAGLACQNMSVAAQLLGYGTKIITSPTMAVNGEKQAEYRELLGIPENQTAVAFLLIGMEAKSIDESVDTYTSATTRNPLDEVVTYVDGQ